MKIRQSTGGILHEVVVLERLYSKPERYLRYFYDLLYCELVTNENYESPTFAMYDHFFAVPLKNINSHVKYRKNH